VGDLNGLIPDVLFWANRDSWDRRLLRLTQQLRDGFCGDIGSTGGRIELPFAANFQHMRDAVKMEYFIYFLFFATICNDTLSRILNFKIFDKKLQK